MPSNLKFIAAQVAELRSTPEGAIVADTLSTLFKAMLDVDCDGQQAALNLVHAFVAQGYASRVETALATR